MSFSERGQTSNKSHKKGEIGAKEHRAVLGSDRLSHAINTGAGAYELLQKTLNNQPNISPAFHICKQDKAAKWKFPCLSGISWFLESRKRFADVGEGKLGLVFVISILELVFFFFKVLPVFDTLDYFYVNFLFLLIFHYCYVIWVLILFSFLGFLYQFN